MRDYPFPVASHSYFRISNKEQEKERFLKDGSYEPRFAYVESNYNLQAVEERTRLVDSPAAKAALGLVKASIIAQRATDPDDASIRYFRKCNSELYGQPKLQYVDAILHRASSCIRPEAQTHWEYIATVLALSERHDVLQVAPSPEVFDKYRQYFETYRYKGYRKDYTLTQVLESHLEALGLAQNGWRVQIEKDASPARINYYKKIIIVGKKYQPRTEGSMVKIAVHEVYGHALRGVKGSVEESEGFAVLLEQLLYKKFIFRRSYRYLAIALGWGVYGKPMTFRQVYEVVWRLMAMAGRYDEKAAKNYAFDECVRAFRGGRPDLAAGAVYLKDAVYFSANIATWKRLAELDLSYEEFVDMIEGRRKVGV